MTDSLWTRAESVAEAAERMWPGIVYDTALPQPWVALLQGMGHDVRGHMVWGYPEETGCGGCPLPITPKGARMLLEVV